MTKPTIVNSPLTQACYFGETQKKNLIVLHFTAGGSARSAINWWKSQANKVSAAYVIGELGTIEEVYHPAYWSYHLGVQAPIGENHRHDKRSIAIELVNWGPLQLKDDKFCSWPGNYSNILYSKSEVDQYYKDFGIWKVVTLDKPYKRFIHWQPFSRPQINALISLVEQLESDFNIPHNFLEPSKRNTRDIPLVKDFSGILCHENFRVDKLDVGPTFPWERLIAKEYYTPKG